MLSKPFRTVWTPWLSGGLCLAMALAAQTPAQASGRRKARRAPKAAAAAALTPAQAALARALYGPAAPARKAALRRPALEEIKAGADLCHCDLSGMDLRGRFLAGLKLEHSDLTRARFDDCDLTRARLGGATMTGTRLAGATLFMTNLGFTIDLDTRGARLHPFFAHEPDPGVNIKEYLLSDPAFQPDRIHVGSPQPPVSFSVPAEPGQDLGLHSLALGPDGCMWFTQKSPAAIRRISQEGLREEVWALPDGMAPETIVAGGPRGAMLFTMAGRAAVGFIWADPAPAKEAAAAASFAVPEYKAMVVPAKPARAPEWVVESPSLEEIERAFALPKAAPGAAELKRPSKEPPKAAAAPAPMLTPEAAVQILEAAGVRLYPATRRGGGSIDHILKRHRYGLLHEDGQFTRENSTPDALLSLLARGVQHMGGEVGRVVVKHFNSVGGRHTPCRMDEAVGYYMHGSRGWTLTPVFDIVTREFRVKDAAFQFIHSAHPVSPNAF
jgi:hypothetical protein